MAAVRGRGPQGLPDAARAVAEAAVTGPRSAVSSLDLSAAVDLAASLSTLHVPNELAAHPLFGLASGDAANLAIALRADPDQADTSVLGVLVRRFLDSGGAAARLAAQASTTSASDPHAESLAAVANAYRRDAADERAAARRAKLAGGFLAAIGLAAAALVGVGVSAEDLWVAAAGRLIAVVGLFVAAALMFRSATAHERASREYVRLERGMAAIEPYLAPLPEAARHFIRATLTQSLFPLLPEDDDPLRQPQWPSPRELLWASYQIDAPPDVDEDAVNEADQSEAADGDGVDEPQDR